MSPWSYTAGVVVLLIVLSSGALVALRLRAWLLPGWAGAPARLAEVVLLCSYLVVLSEALGTVGLFRRAPLLVACLLSALACHRARLAPVAATPSLAPPERDRWSVHIAVGMALFVVAVWATTVAVSFWHGMGNNDTLIYHGPISARFVETGWLTRLHFTHDEPTFAFGPANSELLHAVLALPFRRDFLSPLVALGCAELTLLAAWCLGRPAGVGSRAVVGAGIVVTVPMMVLGQGGQGSNDIAGLAFFLSAMALLTVGGGRWSAVLVAGLAAGLAAGMKVPFLIPAAVFPPLVLLWRRARSTVAVWPWALGAVATGAFWYVRNLARTGSPLPWMHLPGLPAATVVEMRDQGFSLAHYLTDGRLWRSNFIPSLYNYFGPAWPIVLGLPLVALIVCMLRRSDVIERIVAAIGLIVFAGYVVTPFSAGGPRGTAWMFFWDLRFLTPALGLGFSLLPGLQFLRSSRRQKLLLAALLAVVTVTVTASTGPWSIYPSAYPARGMLAGGAVVAGLAAGALVVRRSTSRSVAATVVVFEVALALIAGYGIERRYEAGRYAKGTWEVQGLNPRALYAWAHQVRHTRIGVGGTLRATYPLYGVDLSNVVEYVGHPGAHGNFSRVRGCREWVSRFNHGAYRYVVVGETPGVVMPETTWLSGQAGVSHVLNEGGVSVFHVGEALSPRKCST